MKDQKYDTLKLENQLCFPLYACARDVIRQYKPYLDQIDLTYTQYITMMILWEKNSLTAKELGDRLLLDSGTLTPLLKKMEQKGYLTRQRSQLDERHLLVTLTDKGRALRDQALNVPQQMSQCTPLDPQESKTLYELLYKILHKSHPEFQCGGAQGAQT